MKLKNLICKIKGHQQGFFHKDHDTYFFVCPRCNEIQWQEVKYAGESTSKTKAN